MLLATGCSKSAKATRHAHRADKYFAEGQYSKAEIEYLNALQLGAQNGQIVTRLGTIYYEQGRFSRAYAFLTKAAELAPTNMDLQVKLGTMYLAGRKTKEAREAALTVLAARPADPEAPILLAESISSAREAEDVNSRLTKLSSQLGESAPLQLAAGVLKVRQGDLKAAEAAFKRALELDPKSSAAFFALGNLYSAQGNLQEADPALKAAAELSPPRSPRRLSYADFKLRTGDLLEGKRLLTQISKESPDYLPAWVRQADIALAEKQYTNCASLLTEVLARDSINAEALLLQGRLMLAERKITNALVNLNRLTQLYEGSGEAHYYLALAQLANNDAAKAIKSLNRAVALEPNSIDAVLLLADLNIRNRNASAAVSSLKEFTRRRPQLPQGYLLLATAYLALNDLDDAAAVYQQMMTSFPNSPQVPFLLGLVLVDQKKIAEARKMFEQSLVRSPEFVPATEQLVGLDLNERHFGEAFARINALIEKQPNAPELRVLLARAHLAKAGNYVRLEKEKAPANSASLSFTNVPAAVAEADQAEAALTKALELNPGLRAAYLLLAQVYVAANKHQAALARLNSIVAKTNDVGAWMQIGQIHDELKNYAAAREAYEKLLTFNPNFSPALNNLAYLFSEHLGQLDKAYEMADKARQLLPADPFAADTLGWILYKRHEYTRALGLLEESARMLPNEPEIRFHLGMTYYMLGDEGSARAALQTAAEAAREFPGKEQASQRLQTLAIDPEKADALTTAALEKKLNGEADDPVAFHRLGAIYERDKAFQKAAAVYERALKLDPQNIQALRASARLYAGPLNDPNKALELAREAHNLAPDDARVSHILARLVYQSGDYKWALSLSQEAARKLPDDPEVLYGLAWASYSMGRPDDGFTAMNAALQKGVRAENADDAKRFVELVGGTLGSPDHLPGSERVRQILKDKPDYLPALMAGAAINERNGNKQEAKVTYEKILAANPLFAPAGRALALLCVQDFRTDPQAYSVAAKARESYPQDPAVARALGILTYLRGNDNDNPRAIELLKESDKARPDDPETLYYLGKALRQKQPAQSKDALRRALDLNLADTLAADAKRVLAELK